MLGAIPDDQLCRIDRLLQRRLAEHLAAAGHSFVLVSRVWLSPLFFFGDCS